MRLARCSDGGRIFWAVVDVEGRSARPIAGALQEWAPALTRGAGANALHFAGPPLDLAALRLLAPVEKTNKIVVVGANYSKHLAADFNIASPRRPIAFLKAYGALIGANDPIRYPPTTQALDHEVELVVVVGAARLDRSDPLAGVLGYTVGNDVSARDIQTSGPPGIGMDLFGAKSQDGTTGLGPWIVTRDEFPPGPPDLELRLSVNGDLRQQARSSQMTWHVDALLRFVDAISSLECGDVMFTGSPAGVGHGTGRYLQPGDVVEASIEAIGSLRNTVRRD